MKMTERRKVGEKTFQVRAVPNMKATLTADKAKLRPPKAVPTKENGSAAEEVFGEYYSIEDLTCTVDDEPEELTWFQKMLVDQTVDLPKYLAELSSLKKGLSKLGRDGGYVVKEICPDGNSLFRALADQLCGDESKYAQYRAMAIEYLLENKDELAKEPFFRDRHDEETVEEYCADMKISGVRGGRAEIYALAQKLKFNVVMHYPNRPHTIKAFHYPLGSTPTVYLAEHVDKHYNSVRRADDPQELGVAPAQMFRIGTGLESVQSGLITKDVVMPEALVEKDLGRVGSRSDARAVRLPERQWREL